MTVQEYAEDMNFTVQDVLNECAKLGIKVSNKDDILSDDDIVMLDNTMNLISANEDLTLEETDVIDDAVEDIMMGDELQTIVSDDRRVTEKVKRRRDSESTVTKDKDYQNKGYGKDAVKLALDYILTFPDGEEDIITTSYVESNKVAKHIYESFGFEPNGDNYEDEITLVLKVK